MNTTWLVRLAVIAALALPGCGKKPNGDRCESDDECESGLCACASACRSGCCAPPSDKPPACDTGCIDIVCDGL